MKLNITSQRGTRDILPEENCKWTFLQGVLEKSAELFGFKKITTPTFESTKLFDRSVGEQTDVVKKEMYTFLDKGSRSITLKPEGTACVVRSVLEHSLLNDALPLKLYYFTPCFRYEKPQLARQREFYQFGVEYLGAQSAESDAEVIFCVFFIFKRLNVTNVELRINSMGCEECRKEYKKSLEKFLESKKDELCQNCSEKLFKNSVRILDCKNEKCKQITKNAPSILDFLCSECKEHFENVKTYLNVFGISYVVDPKIVRGLDYYNKTVFEFVSKSLQSQDTLCGGGRYDKLVEQMGGPFTPAIGFGIGFERLLLSLEPQSELFPKCKPCEIYIANVDKSSKILSLELFKHLKNIDVHCQYDSMNRSLRSQIKYADKINTQFLLVIGENETKTLLATLKNLRTKETFEVSLEEKNVSKIAEIIKQRKPGE